MNNPLNKLKTKKCEVCGIKDKDKAYIVIESNKQVKIGKLIIKEKVVLCEECATLGIC